MLLVSCVSSECLVESIKCSPTSYQLKLSVSMVWMCPWPYEVHRKMRKTQKQSRRYKAMTLSPDFSMCLSPHKVERWGRKILFRAEECRRFLSTLRSMRWAPDKGGAGGATCPERLGKWAGGVDFEEGGNLSPSAALLEFELGVKIRP